ncbi:MAG: amidohydrolase [Candidatus Eremiobacterota bacterium]
MRYLLVLLVLTSSALARPAELVLTEGAVYTLDPAKPWARCVAIANGRIAYVGDDPAAWIGPDTRVERLPGRMVLPGLVDCHVHPVAGGVELGQCSLYGLTTREELLSRVAAYAREHPEKAWIVGAGWLAPTFPDSNPQRQDLDAVLPDRPCFLVAADGHSAWVNTAALRRAKLTAGTPDPVGGRIERDPSGEPSGTLRETALGLIEPLLPEVTHEESVAGLHTALEMAAGFGITTMHEARATEKELKAYAELDRQGQLTARMVVALWVDPAKGVEQVDRLKGLRERYSSGLVAPRAAKLFADGIIEGHTAALLEPYLDTGARGDLNFAPEAMADLVTRLDGEGFQVHVHAIGDRAVRVSLDSLAAARRANGWRDTRPHLAHLEMIDPADYPRFRQLDVGATFQPLWACQDDYITRLTLPVLGPERSSRLYPMGSLLRAGARLAGGSDWTVSSLNPLEAIEVAVTRRASGEPPGDPWLPGERLDLATAIDAYTREGAYRSFQDGGVLRQGAPADLVVLERNLFEIQPWEIGEVRVLLTLLEGREVFRAGRSSGPPP